MVFVNSLCLSNITLMTTWIPCYKYISSYNLRLQILTLHLRLLTQRLFKNNLGNFLSNIIVIRFCERFLDSLQILLRILRLHFGVAARLNLNKDFTLLKKVRCIEFVLLRCNNQILILIQRVCNLCIKNINDANKYGCISQSDSLFVFNLLGLAEYHIFQNLFKNWLFIKRKANWLIFIIFCFEIGCYCDSPYKDLLKLPRWPKKQFDFFHELPGHLLDVQELLIFLALFYGSNCHYLSH